jgi:uncharacterized protein (TIGR03000 family)
MPSNRKARRFGSLCLLLLLAAPAWGQQTMQRAVMHVSLPADARLTVDGRKTKQTGPLRHFYSPPLSPGKSYHYTFVWTHRKDGKTYRGETVIYVKSGEDKPVDLTKEKTKLVEQPEDKGDKAERKKPNDKPSKPSEDGGDKGKKKKPGRQIDLTYVPTPSEVVDKMLEMADIKETDVVYNLLCGDGRFVIKAAGKYKCKAVGFDNDDARIRLAKKKVEDAKLSKLVTIKKEDIFAVDLEPASVVLIYLSPEANAELIPQLKNLKSGSRIVSHDFKIEGYPADKDESVKIGDSTHHVYLWKGPLEKK